MVGVDKVFLNLLKGDFLTDENGKKTWRVILPILSMFFVMITCAHKTDEKVMEIAKLKKKEKLLKAKFLDSSTKLTRYKLESNLKKEVNPLGLDISEKQIVKIKVDK